MATDNYRNVYKSDHLGSVDIEEFIEAGRPLIFTISHVTQGKSKVAGKSGEFNIAYFVDKIKPWVLNSGNAKIIRCLAGQEATNSVSTWKNILVELYIDYNVKFGNDIVSGVRVKPIKPNVAPKEKPFFTEDRFEGAKSKGATIEQIKAVYQITPDMEILYNDYVNAGT